MPPLAYPLVDVLCHDGLRGPTLLAELRDLAGIGAERGPRAAATVVGHDEPVA